MARRKTKTSRARSSTISFRLETETLALLRKREPGATVSVHEIARRIVLDTLASPTSAQQSSAAVDELKAETLANRRDMKTIAEILLIELAKKNPEKVRTWLAQNLTP